MAPCDKKNRLFYYCNGIPWGGAWGFAVLNVTLCGDHFIDVISRRFGREKCDSVEFPGKDTNRDDRYLGGGLNLAKGRSYLFRTCNSTSVVALL